MDQSETLLSLFAKYFPPNISAAQARTRDRAQVFEAIAYDHSRKSDDYDRDTDFSHVWHADGVRAAGQPNDGS